MAKKKQTLQDLLNASNTPKTTVSNSFEGGMSMDMDDKLKDESTYELSVNGRIIYNDDGSLSWENAKGNRKAIQGYGDDMLTIGVCEFTDFAVVFSIEDAEDNDWHSEIGVISFNDIGEGSYRPLY